MDVRRIVIIALKKNLKKKEDEQDIEEDSEEVELIWDGVPGIQFTKDVSQLCEDIFDDDEYFVLTDYWVFNLLKELDGER